jgi:hypothetical protein
MHDLAVMLFAVAAGLTFSGIIANLYRLVARKPLSRLETAIHYGVMVVAGPSVLFENATKSFRSRDCSRSAYGLAMAVTFYWSLLLGLLALTCWIHFKK